MSDQSVWSCATQDVAYFDGIDIYDINQLMKQGFKIEFEGSEVKLYHHDPEVLAKRYEELVGEKYFRKFTHQA